MFPKQDSSVEPEQGNEGWRVYLKGAAEGRRCGERGSSCSWSEAAIYEYGVQEMIRILAVLYQMLRMKQIRRRWRASDRLEGDCVVSGWRLIVDRGSGERKGNNGLSSAHTQSLLATVLIFRTRKTLLQTWGAEHLFSMTAL